METRGSPGRRSIQRTMSPVIERAARSVRSWEPTDHVGTFCESFSVRDGLAGSSGAFCVDRAAKDFFEICVSNPGPYCFGGVVQVGSRDRRIVRRLTYSWTPPGPLGGVRSAIVVAQRWGIRAATALIGAVRRRETSVLHSVVSDKPTTHTVHHEQVHQAAPCNAISPYLGALMFPGPI